MRMFLILFLLASFKVGGDEDGQRLIDTENAQKFQSGYDERYFQVNKNFEKLRHILLHLVKSVGKMATYCEEMEHGRESDSSLVIHEVTPDLLFHALQLANYYQINLGDEYELRINKNIQKISP